MTIAQTLTKPEQPPARRSRRSTGEVLGRIVAAAVSEFQDKGYAGARTASIAQRAGVAEALLFKHFGTKEALFQRAIFEQLDMHFTRFTQEHSFDPGDPVVSNRESRAYIDAQQDFLQRHARMFRSLFASEAFGAGEGDDVPRLGGLQDYLDKMVDLVESGEAGRVKGKPDLTARVSFATVLACTLFRDWLFPPGLAGEAEIRKAVTDFVMDGARSVD